MLTVAGLGFVALAVAAPDLLATLYALIAHGDTVVDMTAGTRLGAALFGALTVGWGLTLERLGRGDGVVRAAVIGIVAWYLVDSAASIALGFGWNALSNTGFVVVVLAILRPWR
ncbi:MAG: hypothetical protein MUF40_02810 [Gemmatimonadaceae bacterium]|nr:hypothetical protein [Gemmatimonadaceae bacterium]